MLPKFEMFFHLYMIYLNCFIGKFTIKIPPFEIYFVFQIISIFIIIIGLVVCFLWHINLCRLFNTKSNFKQIIRSISNNSL